MPEPVCGCNGLEACYRNKQVAAPGRYTLIKSDLCAGSFGGFRSRGENDVGSIVE
jgi:hypothetical protein